MKRFNKKDFADDSIKRRAVTAVKVLALSLCFVGALLLLFVLLGAAGILPSSKTGAITTAEVRDGVRYLTLRDEDGREVQLTIAESTVFKQKGKRGVYIHAADLTEGVKVHVTYHALGRPPYRVAAAQVLGR